MTDAAERATRRDFLVLAGGAFAAIGSAAALWPALDSLNPDAAEWATATTEVDLTPIKAGQAITVMWRGQPTFVRHRTVAEIEQAAATPVSHLPDRRAGNAGLPEAAPASDDNRVKHGHE